jgi:hypothetical protein
MFVNMFSCRACCEQLLSPIFQIVMDSDIVALVHASVSIPIEFQNQRFLPTKLKSLISNNGEQVIMMVEWKARLNSN